MLDLFDTHVHLDHPRLYQNLDLVVKSAQGAGIGGMVNVGHDMASSLASVELACIYDCIYAAVGFHPHVAKDFDHGALQKIRELAGQGVVALGEIGLDYYHNFSPRGIQQDVFRLQLDLARELDLPIIVHTRDAIRDTLQILREYGPFPHGGIMHCYSGSEEMLSDFLGLNLSIGLGGPVTFTNARKVRDVAAVVPLESLVLETDCPYLAPHPMRGKTNQPAYVELVAQEVARVRNLDSAELAAITTANARRLFRIGE